MTTSRLRRIALVYPFLMALCGFGYARYDSYKLDGDAVAFMDIADFLRAGDTAHAVNGYWNPGYAVALALGQGLAHPSRIHELQTYFGVNCCIFILCIAACVFFVLSLERLQARRVTDDAPALSVPGLLLAALSLLFASFQRELALGAVRADALLLLFLLLAAGILLRLRAGKSMLLFALLGAVLGMAYLTKSFAFLPGSGLLAGIFVYGASRPRSTRPRFLGGALLAASVFFAFAGPYIAAISRQRGRFTTGESARLNYAFFVDGTERWHEWHTGAMGHATAAFKHHETLLLETPAVYSYEAHPLGTYPLWFDPSFWTDTIRPHFYLHGQLIRLARCTALLGRFLIGHFEAAALLLVLLFFGCFFPRSRASWLPMSPVILWGVLIFALYFPVDLQDRYLTGGLLLVAIPVLACIRRPLEGRAGQAADAAALLLALLLLGNALADLGERRRTLSVAGLSHGAYSPEIYPAAAGLADLGIRPGEPVACFGDRACVVDHYWARLAGTPIRAEIATPGNRDPGAFWASIADKQAVIATLRRQGIAAIVSVFAPSARVPEGWRQLGNSNFYAYPLKTSLPSP